MINLNFYVLITKNKSIVEYAWNYDKNENKKIQIKSLANS